MNIINIESLKPKTYKDNIKIKFFHPVKKRKSIILTNDNEIVFLIFANRQFYKNKLSDCFNEEIEVSCEMIEVRTMTEYIEIINNDDILTAYKISIKGIEHVKKSEVIKCLIK